MNAGQGVRIHLMSVVFLSLVVGLCSSWAAGASDKPKLGVMKFETAKGVDEGLGAFLYDAMSDKLIASGRYTVVDWRKIERTIKALQKAKPGLANDDAMEQAIGQLGLQQVCVGSLTKVGKKYFVTVKILNADMSAARSAREAADSEDALVSSIDKIAAKLVGQVPVVGTTGKTRPKPVPSPRAKPSAKPKIGIMKFDVAKDLKPALGAFLYGELMHEMVQTKQYVVVDWEEIDRVLQHLAKSQPNISTEAARKRAIKQLGIQWMYLGSVAKIGTKYYLSVKVLNLDLQIKRMTRRSVASEDDLPQAVTGMAKELVMSDEGLRAYRLRQAETERAWENAKSKGTLEAYEDFLSKHPKSVYTTQAVGQIAVLRKKAEAKAKATAQAREQQKQMATIAGTWTGQTDGYALALTITESKKGIVTAVFSTRGAAGGTVQKLTGNYSYEKGKLKVDNVKAIERSGRWSYTIEGSRTGPNEMLVTSSTGMIGRSDYDRSVTFTLKRVAK